MPSLDEVRADLAAVIEESVSVIVAMRNADGDIDAAKLALAEDAAEGFRALSRDCLQDLERRGGCPTPPTQNSIAARCSCSRTPMTLLSYRT